MGRGVRKVGGGYGALGEGLSDGVAGRGGRGALCAGAASGGLVRCGTWGEAWGALVDTREVA